MALSRPGAGPLRTDLPWLRHRRAPATRPVDYTHPRRRAAPPAPDPVRPAPAPPPPAAPAPPSLDLSRPSPSLDLSRPARPAAAPARPRRTRSDRLPYPRVRPGETLVLERPRPTVTLTRLQSGVGALQLSLLPSPAAGDLAPGLVLQTTDGATHVVQRLSDPPGSRLATPDGPLPLVRLGAHEGAETFTVDLRQVRRLRRALLYGYSPSIAALTWQGVVVAELGDGTRLEVPFDLPPLSGTVALLTVYVVQGELVLRAELEPFAGPPEAAAQAYGYTQAWLDGRLPAP